MTIRENYEQWLRDFADDQDTIRELKAIGEDEKEMEDRFYTELSFGTAGMRGVLGAGMNRMNKYNVRRATKGLAGYLLENPEEAKRGVVIAYDRNHVTNEALRSHGVQVIEIPSAELSRGRGGPGCTACAVDRDDL